MFYLWSCIKYQLILVITISFFTRHRFSQETILYPLFWWQWFIYTKTLRIQGDGGCRKYGIFDDKSLFINYNEIFFPKVCTFSDGQNVVYISFDVLQVTYDIEDDIKNMIFSMPAYYLLGLYVIFLFLYQNIVSI